MSKADTWITKQGTVLLHHSDGQSLPYRYGDPVDKSLLAEHQLANLDRFTGGDPAVKNEQSLAELVAGSQTIDSRPEFRAAMADAGQPNSTSDPVPGNYGELDADEAARFVQTLDRHPQVQARVIEHELRTEGRKAVLDAVDERVLELGKVRAGISEARGSQGPSVFAPGTKDAVAEPTPTSVLPLPSGAEASESIGATAPYGGVEGTGDGPTGSRPAEKTASTPVEAAADDSGEGDDDSADDDAPGEDKDTASFASPQAAAAAEEHGVAVEDLAPGEGSAEDGSYTKADIEGLSSNDE